MGGNGKTVALTTEDNPKEVETLALSGLYEQQIMTSSLDNIYYIAQNKFWAASTSSTGNLTIDPFRAYITMTGGSVKSLNILVVDEDATGIVSVDAKTETVFNGPANIYNLAGQLVKANATSLDALAPGIYVVGGKKVAIENPR